METLPEAQQRLKSELASHIVLQRSNTRRGFAIAQMNQSLLEEQLSDGRKWLLDTETPGLADISAHILFGWVSVFKILKDLFDPKVVPHTVEVRP